MKMEGKNLYIGTGNKIEQNSIDKYVEIWSDVAMNYGFDKAVKYQLGAATGSTFYYR